MGKHTVKLKSGGSGHKKNRSNPNSRTPKIVSSGGASVAKFGKDDAFLFSGKKLTDGKMGFFFSKGTIRVGVFSKKRAGLL